MPKIGKLRTLSERSCSMSIQVGLEGVVKSVRLKRGLGLKEGSFANLKHLSKMPLVLFMKCEIFPQAGKRYVQQAKRMSL
jgi:hypothetical protein